MAATSLRHLYNSAPLVYTRDLGIFMAPSIIIIIIIIIITVVIIIIIIIIPTMIGVLGCSGRETVDGQSRPHLALTHPPLII